MVTNMGDSIAPSGARRDIPSVSAMAPGAITFERTPRGPSSTAMTLLRASTPAFAAETWACSGEPEGGDVRSVGVARDWYAYLDNGGWH